jgi:RND family efflux transporter MFP subunit
MTDTREAEDLETEERTPPPPVPRAASARKVVIAIGLVVLSVLGLGALLLRRASARTNHVALAEQPKGVTAIVAKRTTYRPTRRFVGTVEPWLSARVGPQMVSAYVGSVLVRPGDHVHHGDVLATLDCQAANAQSQAVAASAKALEERQKAALSEAARLEQLSKGGFVSANELEQRQAQAASNEAQIAAMRAQLAGRSLEVNDCVLRSPFDGEIGARMVDPGAFVRPGSTVVTVLDRRMLRVSADVPEVDVAAVAAKTPARIRFFATQNTLDAPISRRSPSADPSTRSVHVEVDLDPKDVEVPVGTTAELLVDVGEPKEAIELPLAAAKVRGDSASIFVIDKDVAYAKTLVLLGERGGSIFLEPGVAPGALVVTEGRGVLHDGEAVLAKTAAPAATVGAR